MGLLKSVCHTDSIFTDFNSTQQLLIFHLVVGIFFRKRTCTLKWQSRACPTLQFPMLFSLAHDLITVLSLSPLWHVTVVNKQLGKECVLKYIYIFTNYLVCLVCVEKISRLKKSHKTHKPHFGQRQFDVIWKD